MDRLETYLLKEQSCELSSAVFQPLTVRRIYNPDERVGLFEVVLPVRAECLLAADVPCEL